MNSVPCPYIATFLIIWLPEAKSKTIALISTDDAIYIYLNPQRLMML